MSGCHHPMSSEMIVSNCVEKVGIDTRRKNVFSTYDQILGNAP